MQVAGALDRVPPKPFLPRLATRARPGPKYDALPWPGCRCPAVDTQPHFLFLNSAVDIRNPVR